MQISVGVIHWGRLNTLLQLHNSSYQATQPHSLINNFLILSQLRQWFLSYLSNRSQWVALQGTYSNWLQVTSGVPQGLILGPAHYSFLPISMIFPNASNTTLKSDKIKVSVSVISWSASRMLGLITLTETLIFWDITNTESNICFIIHSLEENNDKHSITRNTCCTTVGRAT